MPIARQENAPSFKRKAAAFLVPVAAVVAALCMVRSMNTITDDGEALAARLGKVSADQIALEAAEVADRHPADYFPHLVAAQAYASERPLRADKLVGFANRAMYLYPTEPPPHRLAALALRATGRMAQARIEYKLAYQLHDHSVLTEITRVFKKPEEMMDAVPDTPEALAELAGQLIAERRYDDAEAVAKASVDHFGEKPEAVLRLARIAMARGQPDEAWKLGARLSEIAPEKTDGLQMRVEALLSKNDADGAQALLEGEGLKRFPMDAGVLLSLARLRLGKGDAKGCREALKRLPASIDVGARVAAMMLEVSAAERDGQGAAALAKMRQVVAMRPGDAWTQWQYALLLERLDRLDQAAQEAAGAAGRAPSLRPEADKLKLRVAARKKELDEMRRWKDVEKDHQEQR